MDRLSKITPSSLFTILLILWALLKIAQGYFTEISSDEAYYALYARFLDWGYFDHPPMVALFIRIGSFIKGELGTRLMAIISQVIEIWLLWKIIDEKSPTNRKVLLFFGLAASIIMFHVYGFVMTPDVPLLLFTTLFLFVYKRFLENNRLIESLLLGVVMAGMVYSKYHALLVIGLVILSNLRLLLNWRFWLSCGITLLLLIPHIHWQYIYGFPSFTFHLVSRTEGFNIRHLMEFWLNQLVVFNPAMFVMAIYTLFKYKPENSFERALFFIIGGVIVFFFLISFRGHVEPHWTVVIALPIIILFYKYCLKNITFKRITYRFIFPVIFIILFLGIELSVNMFNIPFGFSHNREFSEKVSLLAGEKPVVFQNNYQRASIYNYYTKGESISLNHTDYRQNQYDLLDLETAYYDKPVLLQTNRPDSTTLSCSAGGKVYLFKPIHHFQPLTKVEITFDLPQNEFQEGERVALPITIYNPYPFDIDFQHPEFPVELNVVFAKNRDRWYSPAEWSKDIDLLKAGERRIENVVFVISGKGEKRFRIGISLYTPLTFRSFNSHFEEIKVQ